MVLKEKVQEILNKGVAEAVVKESLAKKLLAGHKLVVKLGIDPTGADLHLGHAVVLRKLKAWQDLGHQIVLVVGDFTGRIGDPSARADQRKILTSAEVKKNMASYQKQLAKILDLKKVKISYNSSWLQKLGVEGLLDLMSKASVFQVVQRDDFQKRAKAGREVTFLEALYPLLQGYDSVAVKADLELGGTDQTFNLLMGRQIQKQYGQKPQDIITVPLLEGLDGQRKMSKSYNNYIGLEDEPNEMYGKVMSIPDQLIVKYFLLGTDLSLAEIKKIESDLKKGANPRDIKSKLADEIVSLYHGQKKAREAKAEFNRVFQQKENPADMKKVKLSGKPLKVVELLVTIKLVSSKGEARRLVEQGGVKINGKPVNNWQEVIKIRPGMIIQVGKRRFLEIA